MKNTRLIHLAGLLVLGVALVTGSVSRVDAQPSLQRLEQELRRTDDLLRQAEEIVRQALGPRPASLLREARDLQQDAWQHYWAHGYHRAGAKTAAARGLVVKATELARAQIRLLERVRQLLSENRELVARARDAVRESGNPQAERLLKAGVDELDRGQRAFNDGRFRQSVRFSLLGRDLLLRAIRAGEGEIAVSDGRVHEAIARTDEFLREARRSLDDDRALDRQIEDAQRIQDQAREQIRKGDLGQARRLTLRAREMVMQVLRSGADRPDRADVESVIDRVGLRFEELKPEVREADDRPAQRLVEQAEAHLERAREALAKDDLRSALSEAQLAASLLGQAEQRLR